MRRVSAAAFVSLLSVGSVSTLHAQDVDANGAATDAGVIDTYNVAAVPGVATANGNIDQEFSPETYLDLPDGASGRFIQGGVAYTF